MKRLDEKFCLIVTWYKSRTVNAGEMATSILDVTGVGVAGDDGDLIQLVAVYAADAAAAVTAH